MDKRSPQNIFYIPSSSISYKGRTKYATTLKGRLLHCYFKYTILMFHKRYEFNHTKPVGLSVEHTTRFYKATNKRKLRLIRHY